MVLLCTRWDMLIGLVLLSVMFSLVNGILLGRLRNKEEPASNIVPKTGVLFPNTDEAPDCKTDHGYPGLCVDIRMCYAARRAVSSRSHPIRCGWINEFVPKVCCHPDQVQYSKMVFRPPRNRRRNNQRIRFTES